VTCIYRRSSKGGLVTRDIIEETPEIWGEGSSTDSATVERDYDTFAETGSYDETFDEWGYVGPETAAAILKNYVPRQSRILDAACGSGLTGTALRNLGYGHIEGVDISAKLLALADRTGAYDRVERIDMQSFPLPFDDGEFDAVNFIGALTYFETNEILRELCRIVRDQNYGEQLEELERDGLWKRTFGTEPMPYLPHHPEYGTHIKVRYFVYEVM
jgi:SAM-dependent methyltransferase